MYGLKCSICGYNKNTTALEFHHLNPEEKDFTLDEKNMSKQWDIILEEVNKCILVCSNCHQEIHNPEKTLEKMIELYE